ncbi:MAG: glucose-6-phosphate isomerase [Mycoplasmataceae bacterium]|nr:glucose-6-phosphate isomerase [Mycoplasmataceae bacterium]
MKKIKLDISRATDMTNIMKYAKKVQDIHNKMESYESLGNEFLGWKDLPNNIDIHDIKKMELIANQLHQNKIEVLVVIGIGGSYLGVKAGIDFILGNLPTPQERKMEVIFAGESLSSTDLAQKLKYVENKKFAINVISKSGTTTEPAIAFRMFKKLLEDTIGKNNAKDYIIATTDANKGSLFQLANDNGYKKFVIPDNIGGRFSVLTPVGLFPFACVGLNIKKMISGAKLANEDYSIGSLEDNLAYQYAVTRFLLWKERGFVSEMIVAYEPNVNFFLEWWKQLFGESEGKLNKGLLPHSAIFSTDLHSLGQFIQEGSKVLFETVITVKKPIIDLEIVDDKDNLDNLNYLINRSVHEINNVAFQATLDAHSSIGQVPNIHIELPELNEESFGAIVMFFERAVSMSAYLLEVNPFNQPGVEVYKSNMFRIMKKPS